MNKTREGTLFRLTVQKGPVSSDLVTQGPQAPPPRAWTGSEGVPERSGGRGKHASHLLCGAPTFQFSVASFAFFYLDTHIIFKNNIFVSFFLTI